jgi:hypothetical protein
MERCCCWQLIGPQVFKKFSIFYGMWNLITILKKEPCFSPSRIIWIWSILFISYLYKIRYKIIFLLTPRPSYFLTSGPPTNIS